MIGGKPPNPHFNSLFLNQSYIKIVVGDSAVLPNYAVQMACFERNQISGGDSIQSTPFCGNQVVDTMFFVPWPIMTSQCC